MNPSEEAFDAAIEGLLASVAEGATPFQIVAQIGDSSRCVQLSRDCDAACVKSELWTRYRGLIGVNG